MFKIAVKELMNTLHWALDIGHWALQVLRNYSIEIGKL